MKVLVKAFAAVMLVGCASHTPESTDTSVSGRTEPLVRDHAMAWEPVSRGGAALRQAAYIHVLGEPQLDAFQELGLDTNEEGKPFNPEQALETLREIESGRAGTAGNSSSSANARARGTDGAKQGFSHYELSRWERYCDDGQGMDEHDWVFVERNGGALNVPDLLADDCLPPPYSLADYHHSWSLYCNDETLNEDERMVVRNSVRPYTLEDQCQPLNQ